MKRILLFLIFSFNCVASKSQIFIPQLYQGQSINQVIYNGTYSATGNCTGQDYDFDLQYQMISPFATGVDLTLDIYSMSGTLTLNGNAVSEGNTYPLPEPVVPMHFQFTGAGSMDFSVTATGTLSIAAETYPCYVVDKVSQFACNNTYKLMEGEVFVPCSVAVATGVSENDVQEKIFLNVENNTLIAETKTENKIAVYDMLGKIILEQKLKCGKNNIQIPQLQKGIYIAATENRIQALKFVIP